MTLTIVSKKYAKLNNIKFKYLSTKVDKYNNEFAYYSIQNKAFDNIINVIKEIRKYVIQSRYKNTYIFVQINLLLARKTFGKGSSTTFYRFVSEKSQ